MRRIRRFDRLARFILCAGLVLKAWPVAAAPSARRSIAPPVSRTASRRYVPGQLIVKYKPSLTQCAHCLFAMRRAFQPATTDGSASLDTLNRQFSVKRITPLFRTEAQEQALHQRTISGPIPLSILQAEETARANVVKQRFARRSARAPRNAVSPETSHVYLLDVDRNTDI